MPFTIPKCCGRVIRVSPLAINISRYSLPVFKGNLREALPFWAFALPKSENNKPNKIAMRVDFIFLLIFYDGSGTDIISKGFTAGSHFVSIAFNRNIQSFAPNFQPLNN